MKVCGIEGHNLINIDIPFSDLSEPTWLVYATIEALAAEVNGYDFFLNVEDDIAVPHKTFSNVVRFEQSATDFEILHPNRMEEDANGRFCVDLRALPGWTGKSRMYEGYSLEEAINPHSGLLLMSKRKMRQVRDLVDLSKRGLIDGFPGGPMAAAYYNVHRPFTLWRVTNEPTFHFVIHLDRWEPQGTRLTHDEVF